MIAVFVLSWYHTTSASKASLQPQDRPLLTLPSVAAKNTMISWTQSWVASQTYPLVWMTQHGYKQHLLWRWEGLVFESAVQLAHSAFLASAAATYDLAHTMFYPTTKLTNSKCRRLRFCGPQFVTMQSPPKDTVQHWQRPWDIPTASAMAEVLLKSAPEPVHRSTTKESGTWLNMRPISLLCLQLDGWWHHQGSNRSSFGYPLCMLHVCHYGEQVGNLACSP